MNIKPDIAEIAAMLKIPDRAKAEEIIRAEMKECLPLLSPRAACETIRIKRVSGDRVELANGVQIHSAAVAKALAGCSAVAATVCTVGDRIDGYIEKAFQSGDGLRGLVADAIAISCLRQTGRALWRRIVANLQAGFGITGALSPGEGGWSLEGQHSIFACLGQRPAGVELLGSDMMRPLKSVSALYGLGRGIGISNEGQDCAACPDRNCLYRTERVAVEVRCVGETVTLEARMGENLFELLRARGFLAHTPCAGAGTCGKCVVQFLSEAPRPTAQEARLLPAEALETGIRLACRQRVEGPVVLRLPGQAEDYRILAEGRGRKFTPDPPVRKHFIPPAQPDADDGRADIRRLGEACGVGELSASLELLRLLPGRLRAAEGVTAVLFEDRLLALEAGDTSGEAYGAALDLGTTTLVCHLVDLKSGKRLDTEAQLNRQTSCGADVISRISFAQSRGADILRDLIVGQVNEMLRTLCERNGLSMERVYALAAAGNTVMQHFFLGLPAGQMAAAPYSPVTTAALDLSAQEAGVNIGGVVSLLPGISGYVGGDITAGMLACGMENRGENILLIDLGTNGEMALRAGGKLYACSVAAGPAFEGGSISQGVGGVRGAVYSVDFDRADCCRTIGDAPAVGICGSGLIDAVAEMLRCGMLDETGLIAQRAGDGRLQALLDHSQGAGRVILARGPQGDIALTQKDIRQVQLAKAAVAAGLEVLTQTAGIRLDDIGRAYLAGGFGSAVNLKSAVRIGLLPEALYERTVCVGNTAGEGAYMYLLSRACRRIARELAKEAVYIELSVRPEFQKGFVEHIPFRQVCL